MNRLSKNDLGCYSFINNIHSLTIAIYNFHRRGKIHIELARFAVQYLICWLIFEIETRRQALGLVGIFSQNFTPMLVHIFSVQYILQYYTHTIEHICVFRHLHNIISILTLHCIFDATCCACIRVICTENRQIYCESSDNVYKAKNTLIIILLI